MKQWEQTFASSIQLYHRNDIAMPSKIAESRRDEFEHCTNSTIILVFLTVLANTFPLVSDEN